MKPYEDCQASRCFYYVFLSKSKFLVNLLSVSRSVGLGLPTRFFYLFSGLYTNTTSDSGVLGFSLNLNLKLIDFHCLQQSTNHDVRSLSKATPFSLNMKTDCHPNQVGFFLIFERLPSRKDESSLKEIMDFYFYLYFFSKSLPANLHLHFYQTNSTFFPILVGHPWLETHVNQI